MLLIMNSPDFAGYYLILIVFREDLRPEVKHRGLEFDSKHNRPSFKTNDMIGRNRSSQSLSVFQNAVRYVIYFDNHTYFLIWILSVFFDVSLGKFYRICHPL